jgi:hypothetical protein
MLTHRWRIARAWLLLSAGLLGCGDDDAGPNDGAMDVGHAGTSASGTGAGASSAGTSGASGSSTGVAGSAPGPMFDLDCAAGQIQVSGTLDGAAVGITAMSTMHSFINKLGADPGVLEVTFEAHSLRIQFDSLLPSGRSVAARGQLVTSLIDAGNCETGDSPGTIAMDADGDGLTFILTELREAPYCEGAPIEGMLEGCFRFPPRLFP